MKKLALAALVALIPAFNAHAAFDSAEGQQQPDQELSITRVTPEGEDVHEKRQIVITFNRPVVPIGKMERASSEIPVEISPKLNCEWRWLNTTSLSCNLTNKDKFAAATKYNIKINPGIKAEDGKTINAPFETSFITERPAASYTDFLNWQAPGHPVLSVYFNQPVTKKSVEDHLFMQTADKRTSLKVQSLFNATSQQVDIEQNGKEVAEVDKERTDSEKPVMVNGDEARRVWVVEPRSDLATGAQVELKQEPGLVSAEGPETVFEANTITSFETFPEFELLSLTCTNNDNRRITITPADKALDFTNAGNLCDPLSGINLAFSAPLSKNQVRDNLKYTPDIGGKKNSAGWGDDNDDDEAIVLDFAHRTGRTYNVWLPSLKAAKEYTIETTEPHRGFFGRIWHWIKSIFSKQPETAIRDVFDRPLANPFKLSFATGHRRPNFEMPYQEAVLEKNIDSEVPLYVNNLTDINFSYSKLDSSGLTASGQKHVALPKVEDLQYAIPFGIRDMLNGKSGALYGYLGTTPDLSKYKGDSSSHLFAEVTPYQIHTKIGHFTTLIWVTDLASGQPVSGAKVSVYVDSMVSLNAPKKVLASAVTDSNGIATLPGNSILDPNLDYNQSYRDDSETMMVKVDKGGEMALLPLNGDFEANISSSLSTDYIYPSMRKLYGHIESWGTTAQGVYRAGDTIQYKIYVRNQDNNSLVPAPKSSYSLKIIDPKGKTAFKKKNIKLNEFGSFDGEYTVPKKGAVGWYRFLLKADYVAGAEDDNDDASTDETADNTADNGDEEHADDDASDDDNSSADGQWQPMRVLVSDFTPVPFKVSNQLNGDVFKAGDKAEVTTTAALHSGGAYTDARTRITAILEAKPFKTKNPISRDFQFDSYEGETDSQQIFQETKMLNDKGELVTSFDVPKQKIVFGKLTVESAVADDRGKNIASATSADYMGVDRLVGLHATSWLYDKDKSGVIQYIVVDGKGNPVASTDVNIDIENEQTTAAKVKGAGNAYQSEYNTEWVKESSCTGTSLDKSGICNFTPKKSGSYRAVATIKDSKGREHKTSLSFWVSGNDFVVWHEQNDTGLEIIPEKADYNVGDKARYLVKNPYPGATALITIERYGVIDKFVQKLEGSTPIIQFDIKPNYLPGFYLSVIIQSPRVDKPVDANQVDLGKPAFRMGYVKVPVIDKYKEMLVTAKAEREVYKPRDHVKVSLHAEPKSPGKKEPVEIAVAVLDESVFDLIAGGKKYFDPYEGFFKLQGLDLRNYSLLTRLVGRQKFEKKGANPGGDGGADLSMRSIFKFVSYWNPSIKTDANGNANIEFDAPDNLTGWRVLAIATTPTDRLGLGEGNFKVNKPTEIRPVMPNQVTEGDEFKAGFSVMNRTDKPRELTVRVNAEGDLAKAAASQQKIKLDPYKRETVWLPVTAKTLPQNREKEQGNLNFSVTARDAVDGDGLKYSIPVNKRRSLETAANYGTTTQNHIEDSIAIPEKIFKDVGSISVVLSPSVIGNVQGAFKYMRDYPYICWEQRLTKAVMASHYLNLKSYMPDSFSWSGAEKIPDETLADASNFQAPNGGMTYYGGGNDYVDPYLSAYTALGFNWLRESGYKVPTQVEEKLHAYLKNMLQEDILPSYYSAGMGSSVRAVALAALAADGKITLADINRYQPHMKEMSLFGKTNFLAAAIKVKGAEKTAVEVAKNILGYADQTGGKFVFAETLDDGYRWMLSSPTRENCAILSSFTAMGELPVGKDLVGDVPFKLTRTITQIRKQRDYWENTQENLFCMKALVDYSRAYENVKPAMQVTASLDNATLGTAKFDDLRNPQTTFEKPLGENDPGRKTKMVLDKQGDGRVYYSTRISYAPLAESDKPVNSGIDVNREYSIEKDGKWQILKSGDEIKRGDLIRADIFLSLPGARNFVVVDDPVPGGLEPVNRELANTSKVDADKAKNDFAGGSIYWSRKDWMEFDISRWSFYLQEIKHDAVRYYSDYLPPGDYHLSYTAQAIAPGKFSSMPVKAEEMYDPDVFGKGISGSLIVNE